MEIRFLTALKMRKSSENTKINKILITLNKEEKKKQ